jgi:ATP-binding cassette subfamily C protein LapB
MNRRLHDSGARQDAPARTATNAVIEQQRRLAAELAPKTSGPAILRGAAGPFERMLCEVLASIGWQGEQDRIFEALPHLEPIRSFEMLRTVLARLDVSLIPIERGSAELSEEDFPCFLVEKAGNCRLLALGMGGDVEAYDLRGGSRARAARHSAPGTIYLIRAGDVEDAPGGRPFGGFVGHLLKRLRGPVARIVGYSAAINFVGLVLSLYVLMVYDTAIATKSVDTLAFLAIGALAALALELRLRHVRSSAIAYLAARFDGVVSVHALASVLNLPLGLTERAPLASQLSRFRQFEIGRELFAGHFASALFDLPFTLLFVISLFLIGGVLGFVPVGLSFLIVILCALTATISNAQITKVGANRLKSDSLLLELMDKLRTIRNASAENIWLARYGDSLAAYQRARFGNLQLGLRLHTITSGLVALAGIVTLSVGALRVMDASMSLGELIAAMMIVWRVLVPIQIVSLNMARLKQTLSTMRQINDVMRMGNERKNEVPRSL